MITISELTLLDILKSKFKLSEQEAKEVTKEIVQAEQKLQKNIEKKFDSKESSIRGDIAALRDELREHFATKEDIAKSEAKLTMRLFYFSVGQIVVIIGSLLAIIKFMMR